MLRAPRRPVQQTGYCKQDAGRGQAGLILTLCETQTSVHLCDVDGLTALGQALLLGSF